MDRVLETTRAHNITTWKQNTTNHVYILWNILYVSMTENGNTVTKNAQKLYWSLRWHNTVCWAYMYFRINHYSVCCFRACFNTLRPIQNSRHFPDDIFKYIFLNENIWISLKFSLRFVSMVLIDHIFMRENMKAVKAWKRHYKSVMRCEMFFFSICNKCHFQPS